MAFTCTGIISYESPKMTAALGICETRALVQAGETQDILCVFDNPGKWMLHCHMLSHQAGGMKTWVEVQ